MEKKCLAMAIGMLFCCCTARAIVVSDGDLRKKIGQLLMIGMEGTEVSDPSPVVKELKDLNLGGIILFAKNIVNPDQLKKLTKQLQSHAPTPLFIAVDAEGGRVNRLNPDKGFMPFPSAEEMGSWHDKKRVFDISMLFAEQLKMCGCNVNLAPDVDLNVNPKNPVIALLNRSFSSSVSGVVENASAFIEAHHVHKIITAIKHFPGHCSSLEDSHRGFTDVTKTYQIQELQPFKDLIDSHLVDMVMTAHVMNKNIDPDYPATLSPKFIQDILRGKLGFDRVVISDCLCMGAIVQQYSFQDALVRAINAGCDILIISKNIGGVTDTSTLFSHGPDSVFHEGMGVAEYAVSVIFDAVKIGKILPTRIVEASARVETLKKTYGVVS